MTRTSLMIEGMSCNRCVQAVHRILRGFAGVQVGEVNIGSATIAYDPEQVSREQVAQAIEAEGYAVRDTEPAS